MIKSVITLIGASLLCLGACQAETKNADQMTPERLTMLIQKFDDDAAISSNNVRFEIAERELYFVFDTNADRMRVISPIIQNGAISPEVYERMLQANYDAVLDARYAVANDVVWAVFIRPLSTLTKDDFLSGIAQTVTAAETFGTSYTSGALVFGGGDSGGIHENLLKELEEATAEKSGRGI